MRAGIICIIGLALEVSVWAEPYLEGRVGLASGEPAVGAQVQVFDLADLRAPPLTATTDPSGHFTLPLASLAGVLPERFELGVNYPNPFNPSTIIPYQLPAAMHVRLEVFNLLGQRVATLVDGERPVGFHTASWDATDAAGQAVGAGVYLYRLTGDGVQATRSMLLIDGQAGISWGQGGSTTRGGAADDGRDGERAPAYGLTVSGPGLVPYVGPAFRIEAGMAPLDLVVQAPGPIPPAKAASSGGILGDVDNTGRVDFFDALLVALYSRDPSVVMPNNGDISLGDVDADGGVDLTDAWLIAVWLNDPSDPSLPAGIGEPVGPAASLSPIPSRPCPSPTTGPGTASQWRPAIRCRWWSTRKGPPQGWRSPPAAAGATSARPKPTTMSRARTARRSTWPAARRARPRWNCGGKRTARS